MAGAIMDKVVRNTDELFVDPDVILEDRADGSRRFRSKIALGSEYGRCIGDWLEHWANVAPQRLFLAERNADGGWNTLHYGQALDRVGRIATWLLEQRLSAERPVVILSDNSIEHALLALAAMHIGVPCCAISPGNSLLSKDHGKLKANIELTHPGVLFVDTLESFLPALSAVSSLHDGVIVAGNRSRSTAGAISFTDLQANSDRAAVRRAFEKVTPDTIAKFLFTSGSISNPKAVINTQRMLCSSQKARALIWPFVTKTPPILVDWLPWSHTFGGNHNFNLVLHWGGTLYIDDGKPTPALLGKTVRNLKEVAPTVYCIVTQ